jgi:non-specific serine/threonine protein kinase
MARATPRVEDGILRLAEGDETRSVPVGAPGWFAWLAGATTFAYAGPDGGFTARQETVGQGRGGRYWKAYRRSGGRLHRAYLGRSEDLTLARLESAAAELAGRAGGDPVAPPTNLPAALTSFVGRERELAELAALLPTTRLLTLAGAGGVGKTRLALELARTAPSGFPDGVWLADLAPLADPLLVPQAVTTTLGIQEQAGRPLTQRLAAWLASKTALLVLDNCEHLLDACAALAEALLSACPGLSLLATSREPLGIAGETVWRVPSLALPDAGDRASVEALTRAEAVRLFADRARASRPGFAVTAQNAAAVAELCRRVDGIPLALELAAARLRTLPVEEVAARLDDRFRLLTGGSRTALPRHRTLRATIDWSHELLTEPERVLFRRLSVFAGGCTLEAAEAVCNGDGIEDGAVVDLVARLADKSLAQMEDRDGAARCRLLETVRQYAAEKLAEAGEAEATRARHAAWCAALAERAEPALVGPEQAAWLDRLAAERDNLRAALAWSLERDPAAGLGLAASMWAFWRMRGSHFEGCGWLERLLARAPARTATRVKSLLAVAFLARMQGDRASARAWADEALALGRTLGDPAPIMRALTELGTIDLHGGDYQSARAWLEEALPLWRSAGDQHDLAEGLRRLGMLEGAVGGYARARALLGESLALHRAAGELEHVSRSLRELAWVTLCQGEPGQARALAAEALAIAGQVRMPVSMAIAQERLGQVACWEGDLDEAAGLFEASLAGARAVNYLERIGWALVGLGQTALRQGDAAGARPWLEEALAVCCAKADRQGIGAALHELGLTAWRAGDAADATGRLGESLALRRELGERLGIAEGLEGLAAVEAETGQAERAARWLGAADGLREAIGAPLPPVERPEHEATLAAVRATLGEPAFAAAWSAGQAMTVERAVAEALGEADGAPPPAPAAPASPPAPGGLTGREVEVLRLLAAGRSNRQIAAALSVSVRTIERHVGNLYLKIDAHNRADATAFAFRHGLL